jgi:sialic acid synthase SpsE
VVAQTECRVADRVIGPGHPLFFIAEIGLNHNQDLDLAIGLIDAAADAGCSAAKFQTFQASDVYVEGSRAGIYHLMGQEIPIFDLHKGLEMSAEWVRKLKAHCDARGIIFFSAPIGMEAVAMLSSVGTPALKISSYELTNLPFVKQVAEAASAVILSTGAANLGEIEAAVRTIQAANCPLAVMHCVTEYPAPLGHANLAVMDTLRSAFGIPVGFSDNGFRNADGSIDKHHIPGAAAAMGADLFEVHITLDRELPGPDHGFATEPDELALMVQLMNRNRLAFQAGQAPAVSEALRGSSEKRSLPSEAYVREFAFKGIFSTCLIQAGDRLGPENLRCLRPGEGAQGIAPRHLDKLLGRRAPRPLAAFEPVTWDWLLGE